MAVCPRGSGARLQLELHRFDSGHGLQKDNPWSGGHPIVRGIRRFALFHRGAGSSDGRGSSPPSFSQPSSFAMAKEKEWATVA